MSKISYIFIIGLLIFSFMTVQSLIPVFANSSTATIIGGATNGNIFGSVQLDELNFTSTVAIRSNGDDGPVWFTVTYPTTLAWNATWLHTGITLGGNLSTNNFDIDMGGGIIDNIGAGGVNEDAIVLNNDKYISWQNTTGGVVKILNLHTDDHVYFNNPVGGAGNGQIFIRTSSTTTPSFVTRAVFGGNAISGSSTITWFEPFVLGTANNTGSIWTDAVRPADTYSVNDHAKVQITGLIVESDYSPKPGETFEQGDIVCLDIDPNYYTKCSVLGDKLVLGPVYNLEKIDVIGSEMVNGSLISVYGVVSIKQLTVISGPIMVKVCDGAVIVRGDLLIAGENGCAESASTLDTTQTINNKNVPFAANVVAFGIAGIDAVDGWVHAEVGYGT